MANSKNNVKRTAITLNSPWLKNTLKSMGMASSEVIRDLMPATSETFNSTYDLSKDAIQSIKSNRGTVKIGNVLKDNKAIKLGQDFFKNAIEDIKSGDFYSDTDSDDFGMDDIFGDIEDFISDEDNTDVNIHTSVIQQDNSATLKMIQQQTEYQVKSSKATVDTMVSIASASISRTNQLGMQVLSELSTINKNLSALIDYQNTNMTKFIEASIGYYEQMTTKEEYKTSSKIKAENVFGIDGGLDMRSYKDYVKQNLKESADSSMVNTVLSMVSDNPEILAHPMQMISTELMKGMVPSLIKESMAALDKAVENVIPVVLERIGNLDKVVGSGPFGIISTISNSFGIKTNRKTEFDTSNIKKGPMPYNGMANHTLVEIIPKYLRESNNYLREIAMAVTKKDGRDLDKNVTGYDWQTGKFKNIGSMRDDLFGMVINEVVSTFEKSEFGKKLTSKGSHLTSDDDRNNYNDALSQFYNAIERHSGAINYNDNAEVNKLIESINASGSIKNLLKASIYEMRGTSEGQGYLGDAAVTKQKATRKKNAQMVMAEEQMSENGLFQVDGDIDQWYYDKYHGNTNATISKSAARRANKNGQSVRDFEKSFKDNPDFGINTTDTRGWVNASSKSMNSLTAVLNGIMSGNADAAWDSFIKGIGNMFSTAGTFLSKNFFSPIKKSLFGEKDTNGYLHGGLFEGINNRMKDSFYSLRRMVTGKGYVDADGKKVEDANDEEMKNTVVGKLKNMSSTISESLSIRLFGKKESADGDDKSGKGIMGKFSSGLMGVSNFIANGLHGWKTALFGEKADEDSPKKTVEDIKKKAKEVLPDAIAGSVVGAGTGLVSGGLLGTLVGGPIGGALLGFAGGIVSKSDKFKKWLFGDDDTDGVISKDVQEYVKNNGKFLAGGAALGAIKGTITGGGFLGTLVGGPLAGALMGIGSSMILKSQMFQRFLYGDEKTGQLGLIKTVKSVFGSFGKVNGDVSGAKLTGVLGVGAGVGAITLGAISKAGILGLSLGPAGPIGGAILGLGAGILAQKDNFREWLFGKKDDDGNKVKEGILGQFKNMLTANVLHPMMNFGKEIGAEVKDFIEFDVLSRFNLILEGIGKPLFGSISKLLGRTMDSLSDVGTYIKEDFLRDAITKIGGVLVPITDAASTVARGMIGIGKKMISAPMDVLYALTSPIMTTIGGALGSVVSATGTVIDKALIKPIHHLVIKPLAGITKGVFSLVSKPFIALGNVVENVSHRITKGINHVSRFIGAIGERVVHKVTQPFHKAAEFITAKVDTAKDFIKVALFDPWKERVNNAIDEVKNKITGFFKKAFSKVVGVVSAPFKFVGKLIGKGLGAAGEAVKNKGGVLGQLWRDTSMEGYSPDRSDMGELSYSERRRALKTDSAVARERRANMRRDNRMRSANERLIAKYTNNQQYADTEENRRLAEIASGKKIRWKDIAAVDKQDKLNAKIKEKDEKDTRKATQETRDVAKESKNILQSIRDILKSKLNGRNDIPRHETGIDSAQRGLAIVGEVGPEVVYSRKKKFGRFVGLNGPEVVNMEGGETVIPNNRINRYEFGAGDINHSGLSDARLSQTNDNTKLSISERILKTINSIKNRVIGESDSNGLPILGDIKSVTSLTGERLRAQRAKEKEENEDDERQQSLLDTVKSLLTVQTEQRKSWLKMFGKTGLLTVGALWLFSKLKNTNFGDLLSGAFGHFMQSLGFAQDGGLGDGKSSADKIMDEINDAKNIGSDLLHGDILGAANKFVYDENGNANHQSGARAKILTKSAAKLPAFGAGIVTKAGAIKSAGLTSESTVKTLSKNTTKLGANTLVNKGKSMVKNNMGKLTGKATISDVAKASDDVGKGVIDDAIKAVKSFFSGTLDKIAAKTGKNIGSSAVKGVLDDVVKFLTNTKFYKLIVSKIAPILGVTVGLAATGVGLLAKEATWVVLGAINGATGAKRLFRTDDVDALMITISTAIGAFAGSTIGSICDVINELCVSIIGVDIFTEFATLIYVFLAGKEKGTRLTDSQLSFQQQYDSDRASSLKLQYKTMVEAGLLDPSISEEEYIEGAKDGLYGAKIQSFADYNDEKHKTLGAKIGSGLSKAGKGIGKGFSAVGGAIFGKTETYYEDNAGNKYYKNDDGSYQVYNSSGENLGFVGESALTEDIKNNKVTKKSDGFVQKAGKAIGHGVSKIGQGVSKIGNAVVTGVQNLGKGISDKISDVSKGFKILSSFIAKEKEYGKKLLSDKNSNLSDYFKYEDDENNPLNGILKTIAIGTRLVQIPIALVRKVGQNIGNKIKDIINTTKNTITGTVKGVTDIAGMVIKGDPKGLLTYSVQSSEDSPVYGIANAIIGGMKTVTVIPTLVSCAGHKAYDFVKGIIDKAKNSINGISTGLDTMKEKANAGDLEGIWNVPNVTDEGNPVSFFSGAVMNGAKVINSIVGITKFIGNAIHQKVDDVVTNVKTNKTNFDNTNATLKDAAVDGDLKKIWSTSLTLSDGDILKPIWSVGITISKLFNSVIGIFNMIAKPVGEAIDTAVNWTTDKAEAIAEWTGDKWDAAAQWTSDKVDAAKTFASNAAIGASTWVNNTANSMYKSMQSYIGGWGEGSPDVVNGSPYYSQNDSKWANKKFIRSDGVDDGSTIGNSGCGPTAMAMAISHMRGKATPTELAGLAQATGTRDNTGTNWNFINTAANAYGLSSSMSTNPTSDTITQGLSTGSPMVLSGIDDGSIYTPSGHYVVAVGKDSSGNILINDPRGESYSGKVNVDKLAKTTNAAWTFGNGGFGKKAINKIFGKIRGGRGSAPNIIQAMCTNNACYKAGKKLNVRGLMLHSVGSAQPSASVFVSAFNTNKPNGRDVCVHAFIDANSGDVYQTMPWDMAAWHAGGSANKTHIGVEMCEPSDIKYMGGSRITVLNRATAIVQAQKAYDSAVQLFASLCKQFGLDPLQDGVIISHAEGCKRGVASNHGDPEHLWQQLGMNLTMDKFRNDVNNALGGASVVGTTGTVGTASLATNSSGVNDIMDVGSALASFGTTLFNAVLTGNYDSSVWDTAFTSTNTTSNSMGSQSSNTAVSGASIAGTTVKEKVWNYFKSKGLSDAAIAGIMGNLEAESGVVPNNLQNTYNTSFGLSDNDYTYAVNNRSYSKSRFVNDKAGYGLAQWTYNSRKKGLYELMESTGRPIDDVGLQLDYLWHELTTKYPSVMNVLKSSPSVRDASNAMLLDFERPADMSGAMQTKRASLSQGYMDLYGGRGNGATIRNPKYMNYMTMAGGRGNEISRLQLNTTRRLNNYNGGGRGESAATSQLEVLLSQVIEVLKTISSNTNNLTNLKDVIRSVSNNSNVIVQNTNNTNVSPKTNNNQSTLSGRASQNETLARRIAFGQ